MNLPRQAERPVLKRRKPTLLLRLDGSLLLRFADRVFRASLLKLPPRLTRLEPVWSSSFYALHGPEESPAQMQGVRVLDVSQHTFHGLYQSAFGPANEDREILILR